MPAESKTLTEQRIRKERALASMRELQLKQLEGKLLWADQVEQAWAGAIIRFRNPMLAIPSRCAGWLPDPRHAEAIIRAEVEIAQLKGRA
jgi:hypothetical protein